MKQTKLEILLVEDEESHIELIRRSFLPKEDAVNLTALKNLQVAKSYLERYTPGLVIADYLLPDGKGTSLLEGHKERLPYPVIIMTSYGNEGIAVDAIKSGALDYIVKSSETFADMPHICERALREWDHITKRKQAEDELQRQKEFSESLVNSSVDGILAFDLHFCLTMWNPGMERITGMSKTEVVGKYAFEALPFLKETGEDACFSDAIAGKTIKSKDRQYFLPKAGGQGFFDGHYSPLLNMAGEIIGGVAIIIDTTEQKNKDRLLLLKSRQAQMGEMLSMIAHQWRQPLTTISVITGKMKNRLLLRKLAKKELVASLEKIQNHVQFLSQTIDDFRNLFKPNKFPELTAIESVVEKSLFIIGKQFEAHNIKLECVYEYKKELNNGQYIIVISAYSEPEYLIQLINEGIYRFVLKPIDHRVLLNLLFQVSLNILQEKEFAKKKSNLALEDVAVLERQHFTLSLEEKKGSNIIGNSDVTQKMCALVQILAGVKSTVLISGESGVGKELIAEAIHFYKEENKKRPFVKVNCASLSDELLESELFGHVKGAFTGAVKDRDGRFQRADGGTIFLDEIGDISSKMQLRLLRVLQEMEFERVGDSVPVKVDVRVIAATNKDLLEKVKRGTFRNDLYYRLKVVEINVPPLRERRQDIPLLALHFLDKLNRLYDKKIIAISQEVLNVFLEYDWPGNVRELKHVMENMYVLCKHSTIALKDLPEAFRGGMGS